MKLTAQEKKEFRNLIPNEEFKKLTKNELACNAESRETIRQYIDFLQFVHKMAGHPVRKFKPIKGEFIL